MSTRDGRKASQDLAAKVEPERKEFASRQEEVVRLEDQLQKGAAILSEDKKDQLQQTIDEKKKKLARDAQDADEQIQQEQQRIMQTFGPRMLTVIGKYAAEHQYSLVLAVGTSGSPIIHWRAEDDISKQVAEAFDNTPPAAAESK